MTIYRVGGEVQVNVVTANDQETQKVAALPDGGWIVVWTSEGQDGDSRGVYQRRYDANGQPTSGADTLVNQRTVSDQREPSVAVLTDGGWVVT